MKKNQNKVDVSKVILQGTLNRLNASAEVNEDSVEAVEMALEAHDANPLEFDFEQILREEGVLEIVQREAEKRGMYGIMPDQKNKNADIPEYVKDFLAA